MQRYSDRFFNGFQMEPDRVNFEKVYVWEPMEALQEKGRKLTSLLQSLTREDGKEMYLFFATDSVSTIAILRFVVNDAAEIESSVIIMPFVEASYLLRRLEEEEE